MLRRLNRLWALGFILMSSQALALGLGDIRLESSLNEPLRAEIALISATPEELESLKIRMASAEAFARYGLERPAFLSSVNFRVIPSGRSDGNIVRVTSALPITEPFLTFLVEADWAQGRLLREYTVLLDPPTFTPAPSESITESVQPPVRSQPADAGEIVRPEPSPAPEPAPTPAPVRTPAAAAAPAPGASQAAEPTPAEPTPDEPAPAASSRTDAPTDGDYRVQRGDTLWGIAIRFRPDESLTINQTMLAIFEANPEAFSANINRLAAGADLRIPSAAEAFRITRADAFAEVQRQNDEWAGGAGPTVATAPSASAPSPAPQPSLELVPPDEDSLSAESSTVYDGPELDEDESPFEPSGLDSIRIAEIEDLIADQQEGLVVISDNELAALRRELAELRGEEPPADLVADTAADDEEAAAPTDDIFAEDEAEAVAADDTEAAEAAPEPEEAEPAPAPRPAAQQPQPGFVDTVLGYLTGIWGMVGLAVVLAVGVLLFFARRAARSDGDDDATAMWQSLDEEEVAQADQTTQMPTFGNDDDEAFLVEEDGGGETAERPDLTQTMEISAGEAPLRAGAGEDSALETVSNPELDETFSTETALNIEQTDPIAEADFHMAYGLYDQAADLVNSALAADPDRTDLLAKLCEIYFVWGNRDAFIDAAERFKTLLGDGEDPEWDKTVIMGQQIADDHALFSDVRSATKAVDLAFDEEGTESALDMDLDAGPQDDGDFIDLGAEEPAEVAANETNTAIDFVFDDEVADASAGTAASGDEDVDPFAATFDEDAKTTEMPGLDESDVESSGEHAAFDTGSTGDTTIDANAASEMPEWGDEVTSEMPGIGDDEATRLASVDDETADGTSEIDIDDLDLDLDSLRDDLETDEGGLSDRDAGSESAAFGDELPAGSELDERLTDTDDTGRFRASSDNEGGDDEEGRTSLLDATGQTQILPDDFAVETGTGTNIEEAMADDESAVSGDAETTLASVDEGEDGDSEFAVTEALSPDDAKLMGDAPDGEDMDLDLDLDDLTAAIEMNTSDDTGITRFDDADVEQSRAAGEGNGADDSHTAILAPEELSEDLHDARTMTEVGTKLDLARAYVDMGDPGGARSILEEVLDEGDASQRQQAQQLLDSLPAA